MRRVRTQNPGYFFDRIDDSVPDLIAARDLKRHPGFGSCHDSVNRIVWEAMTATNSERF